MSRNQVEEQTQQARTKKLNLNRSSSFLYRDIQWLSFPKRPDFTQSVYTIGKKTLDKEEKETFESWLEEMKPYNPTEINRFEHNLETWRQLWRVLEKSNIICVVCDARFPHLTIPNSLISYLKFKKIPVVLILNKIDLVDRAVVAGYYAYFTAKTYEDGTKMFEHVVLFSCSPRNLHMSKAKYEQIDQCCRLGPADLLRVLESFCGDVNDWPEVSGEGRACLGKVLNQGAGDWKESVEDKNIVVGILGVPNVGKSSLMNRLVGKKVTRTSITPGATKYYQTYNVSAKVQLCDCPGIVFPACGISYAEQVISGAYPISQVQEPYTIVGLLACHSNLVKELKLRFEDDSVEKTAWEICEAYTDLQGYYTGKGAGKLDVYRGANEILRRVLKGNFESVHSRLDVEVSGLSEVVHSYLNELKVLEQEISSRDKISY